MEEINELNDKYLVLKWKDITDGLSNEHIKEFADLVQRIDAYRRLGRERPVNKYVVLNLDDEANIDYIISKMVSHTERLNTPYVPIKDIAVDLVNSILIAGNP